MQRKIQYYAKDLLEQGKEFVLARIVNTDGSAPRKEGAWMILTEDNEFLGTVGGGKIEAVTQEYCREFLQAKGGSKEYHFKLNTRDKDALDMGCGGEADVLIEYISGESDTKFLEELTENPKVYIFGGGHVGLALEPVMRHIDFDTVVIDDREEFANADRFPLAKIEVIDHFDKAFQGEKIEENQYIVIVTRGHMGDYQVLRQALRQKNAYVGMIGSKKKNALLFAMLRQEGFGEDAIAKVYAPIGENIFAETPEEIAISIAAEIIKVRAGKGDR